ncbi:hypothetical protein FF38_12114 [Lucilia cuprina]|uniref:Uncharacterized protein n=1 Tax=Lucilia cuprina TaxID=7375 RepID=A0A0L0BS14_LUCCU|nr:hypothetical protein FF38_12114 [Lucilia cuprina]
MKFAIVFCIIALATFGYSQPLTDTANNRPSPPVLKPVKESAKPSIFKPAPSTLAKEPNKAIASEPVKEHLRPPVLKPVTNSNPQNYNGKPQKLESFINVIIDHNRHKPEVDYFNGKIVPTPKYPSY